MAFDRSMRSIDKDGRMHVERTRIAKAGVSMYLGAEIPGWDALGLDPTQIYKLWRHPDELAKGADTFRNIPLLIKHIPVHAQAPSQELTVGTTGSEVEYEDGYLWTSLGVWTAPAIAAIDTKAQEELSPGYHYRADMTPGVTPTGEAYHGVMRDIVGNHVALVEDGRQGPDVVVADSKPEFLLILEDLPKMKKTAAQIRAALAPLLALDADPKLIDAACAAMAMDTADDPEPAMDENDEDMEDDPDAPGMKRKKVKAAIAKDEVPAMQPAMDTSIFVTKDAMSKAVAAGVALARAESSALHTARGAVRSLVGELAMDALPDAAAVYRFALEQHGVAAKDIHESALPAMIDMVKTRGSKAPVSASMALDSANNEAAWSTAFGENFTRLVQ
jgi:hypothetical protein